jgi:hypothetical protein
MDNNERWKALHRKSLLNKTDTEIISKYNSEIRGIYHYYWLAQNVSSLNKFYYIMKSSMLKTLAGKYRTKVSKVKSTYMINGIIGVNYKTKKGEKRCEFYHDGFTIKKVLLPAANDMLPQYVK